MMSRRAFWSLMVVVGVLFVAASAMAATSTGVVSLDKPDWWQSQENTSNTIAKNTIAAVPFPSSLLRDSLERRTLLERLLRFNRPNKIGYLYVVSFGKFVGYYVVKGKISSTQSQMTNVEQTWRVHDSTVVVNSIGDDGSFGPNEGGDKGVFFFTATGVMVETTLDWIYSDAPLKIAVPNLLAKT